MEQQIIEGATNFISPEERARLVQFCSRLTGNVDVAEDLAQETLLEAWRHLHNLRDHSKRQQWLCGIARNVCLRWQRKHGIEAMHLFNPDVSQDRASSDLDDLLTDMTIDHRIVFGPRKSGAGRCRAAMPLTIGLNWGTYRKLHSSAPTMPGMAYGTKYARRKNAFRRATPESSSSASIAAIWAKHRQHGARSDAEGNAAKCKPRLSCGLSENSPLRSEHLVDRFEDYRVHH
jgi:hypothetical protein